MKRNNKGFTLAEMLIVVAIIGVLVAIVSVTISNSLEKSREAADLANIRSACSEMVNMATFNEPANNKIGIAGTGNYRTYVKCKSTKDRWQTSGLTLNNDGGALIGNEYCKAPRTSNPVIRIEYNPTTNKFSFDRMGESYLTKNVVFYN